MCIGRCGIEEKGGERGGGGAGEEKCEGGREGGLTRTDFSSKPIRRVKLRKWDQKREGTIGKKRKKRNEKSESVRGGERGSGGRRVGAAGTRRVWFPFLMRVSVVSLETKQRVAMFSSPE